MPESDIVLSTCTSIHEIMPHSANQNSSGSDHPAIVEALAAAKAGNVNSPVNEKVSKLIHADESIKFPNIITCPSEMVALSAALGYAQVTGSPVGMPWTSISRTNLICLAMCDCARRLRNACHGTVDP